MRRILHLAAATLAAHLSYSITDGTRIGSYIGNIVQDLSEISLTSSSAIFQVVKGADVINVSPEGDLRVITEIDRENGQLCSKDDHTCSVDAEILYRKDNEFKLFYVDLEIVDINDNSPEFEKSSIELHLPENSAIGSTIRLPSAMDPDSSEFSIDRYQVSPAMFFEILPRQHANGKIIPQLVLKRPLDFEKRELHELELVAFDKGGLTGSMKINLLVDDVNDHSPIFEESSVSIELSESTAMGSVIYKLNASDGDRGRYGVISYSYDDVLTDALSRTIFAINSSTGDITVSSELNYEKQKKHVLYIEAFDGSESALMTVTINIFNVNDNPPEIDIKFGKSSVEGRISEDAPVGSFVGFVSITDSDKDQKLNVSLVNDDGDFELENMSDSEGSNGYILKVAKPLDRERVHLYRIDLRAADNGSPPLTTTKTISIKVEDVNDNAPFFQRDMYHVNILENNDVGKSIVSLKATDVDEGQNAEIEYILGEESSFFSLERGTGDLIALQSLDAELNSRHVVRIVAVDRGSPSLKGETSVIINVLDENDNDPAFEQVEYDFSFPENTEEGETIGTVAAIDADKNSEVRYRLASNSVPFRISPQTGSITLQRSIDADIDNTKYEIMIIAEDKDGRSATASVTIIVNDINDNAPVLIWPNPDLDVIQVTLDRKVSEKVGTIKVRDRDQGANGEIIITQINPRSRMFQINSAGEVFLASKLKRSNLGANPVLICISDGGSPPLQINSRVNIYVTEEETKMTAARVHALLPEFKRQSLSLRASTSQLAFFLVAIFTALVFVVFIVTFYVVVRRRSKSQRNFPPPPSSADLSRCNQIKNPHHYETPTHKPKPKRPPSAGKSFKTSPRHSRVEFERVKWQVELTSANHPQCTIENSFNSDSGRDSASDASASATNEQAQIQQIALSSPKSTHSSLTSARPTFSTFMDESDQDSVHIVESEREIQKIWPSLEKNTPNKNKPPIHPRSINTSMKK